MTNKKIYPTFHSEHKLALVFGVGLHQRDERPVGFVHHGPVVPLPVAQLREEGGERDIRGGHLLKGHLKTMITFLYFTYYETMFDVTFWLRAMKST